MDISMLSNLRKFTKKCTTIKSSKELLSEFMGSFNGSIQSTRHVSTCLVKLNELMDSFNVVKNSVMELD